MRDLKFDELDYVSGGGGDLEQQLTLDTVVVTGDSGGSTTTTFLPTSSGSVQGGGSGGGTGDGEGDSDNSDSTSDDNDESLLSEEDFVDPYDEYTPPEPVPDDLGYCDVIVDSNGDHIVWGGDPCPPDMMY